MQLLARGAAELGLPLTDNQLELFKLYQALLLAWNQRMNLTAVRQPQEIQLRHFLDSLSCARVMGDLSNCKLADVGTGAGFPGLPLKILYPDLSLTLVESIAKKSRFLRALISELGLADVSVVTERAELLGHQAAYRGHYDWVISRGVAELRALVEYLLPLCRLGGKVLAQKGENAEREIAEAQPAILTLGGAAPSIHRLRLPGKDHERILVVIEKVAQTPAKYPRRVGIPAKRPL